MNSRIEEKYCEPIRLCKRHIKSAKRKINNINEEYHEAISVLPAPTEEQKGTIAACTEIGYILNDKVIRYAKVIVFN